MALRTVATLYQPREEGRARRKVHALDRALVQLSRSHHPVHVVAVPETRTAAAAATPKAATTTDTFTATRRRATALVPTVLLAPSKLMLNAPKPYIPKPRSSKPKGLLVELHTEIPVKTSLRQSKLVPLNNPSRAVLFGSENPEKVNVDFDSILYIYIFQSIILVYIIIYIYIYNYIYYIYNTDFNNLFSFK
jgi:hypothetical protein